MASKKIQAIVDETRVLLESVVRRFQKRERVTNSDIDREIKDFMRVFVRSDAWRVVVPGIHTGGITHQGLLLVLAKQGRDFLQSTVQLYQAVDRKLRDKFIGSKRLPRLVELKRTAEEAILEHVEKRLSVVGNYDIRVTPLTREYARRKARMGRGHQPIGVASGELRAALSRNAHLVWLR